MKCRITELILSPSSPRKTARRATASPLSSDTGPPWVQDALPDDLLPSLPPDWEPPACSTPETPSSEMKSVEESKHTLDEEVSMM